MYTDFRANSHAISRAQKIQKWTVLPRDFSIHGGELGKNQASGGSRISQRRANHKGVGWATLFKRFIQNN